MKIAIVLCALATVCCFSTGEAANTAGTAALTRLKSDTQRTTDEITRYSRNLIFNLRTQLSNLKLNAITNVNSITSSALTAVQSEIDAGKANGKNVDHCFEPSRQRVRLAVLASWKVLDQCADNGLATVNPVKNNIDALALLGNQITNQLNSIAIGCSSGNSMAMQNCIIAQIPEASNLVQNYKNTFNQLKTAGDSAASDAQVSTNTCYLAGVQTVNQESSGARVDAQQCVANA